MVKWVFWHWFQAPDTPAFSSRGDKRRLGHIWAGVFWGERGGQRLQGSRSTSLTWPKDFTLPTKLQISERATASDRSAPSMRQGAQMTHSPDELESL